MRLVISRVPVAEKSSPPKGLEIFNWQGYWESVEENSDDHECIVMAGELLHRLTEGKITPTSHRVVVALSDNDDNDNDRYSCPFELLLHPYRSFLTGKKVIDDDYYNSYSKSNDFKFNETSQDYISRTSQKLVSVNK